MTIMFVQVSGLAGFDAYNKFRLKLTCNNDKQYTVVGIFRLLNNVVFNLVSKL